MLATIKNCKVVGNRFSQVIGLDCGQLGVPSNEWVGNGELLRVLEQGSDWQGSG